MHVWQTKLTLLVIPSTDNNCPSVFVVRESMVVKASTFLEHCCGKSWSKVNIGKQGIIIDKSNHPIVMDSGDMVGIRMNRSELLAYTLSEKMHSLMACSKKAMTGWLTCSHTTQQNLFMLALASGSRSQISATMLGTSFVFCHTGLRAASLMSHLQCQPATPCCSSACCSISSLPLCLGLAWSSAKQGGWVDIFML